jgi:four helix bundle protein
MSSKYNLELRLIQFAAMVIDIAESLPQTFAGNHLAAQLIRSGTSPSLNYGEAQSAESRNDFIHKMKIALKELRETFCCLKIIQLKKWLTEEKLAAIIDENNQLIAIFVKCIETAQKNSYSIRPK